MLLDNLHDTCNAWDLAVGVVEEGEITLLHVADMFLCCFACEPEG